MRDASRPKRAYNRRIPLAPKADVGLEAGQTFEPKPEAFGFHAAETNVPRSSPRPADPREDSRARAAARTQQLMADIDIDNAQDRFEAPPPPDGWTYEWKTVAVLGKEDPSYQTNLDRMGWEPVDATRHPGMMPKGFAGPVMRDGMMLMERPKQITDKVKQRDRDEANRLVRSAKDRMNQSQPGQFDRVDQHGRETAKISSDWRPPIQVPADS